MNLLKREKKLFNDKNNGEFETIFVGEFREKQYELLEYFLSLCVNYISSQDNDYLEIERVQIERQEMYTSIHNDLFTNLRVYAKPNDKDAPIIKTFLPTLVDGSYFIINENFYIPTLYILDKPIEIKKSSIKLSSTFNSITIFSKFVTFMGINIPAEYFMNLFLDASVPEQRDIKDNIYSIVEISERPVVENDILKYFGNKLNCEPIKSKICEILERIFFDDYTRLLYENCYTLPAEKINITEILKKAVELKCSEKEDSFIDLDRKRVIFLEMLLSPLFKKVAEAAFKVARGMRILKLEMSENELLKHFHSELSNRFIYDCVNAYDTIIKHKAYMLKPKTERPPAVIANLHPTHYKRICPISVSSEKPGESVHLIPDTILDYFGQFV